MINKEDLIQQGYDVREWSLRSETELELLTQVEQAYPEWRWRTGWGPGPWENEPDRVLWTKPGSSMPRLALRNARGNWCGYVGLPPSHSGHGIDMSAWDYVGAPRVHGGVTYSEECAGHICHVPAPGEPEHVWWIGFDCCHAGDYSPGRRIPDIDGPEPYTEPPPEAPSYAERYRMLDYVINQCEQLADQLEEHD